MPSNPDFVLSLARGLAVIEAFRDRPHGASVADIAGQTALSRASVRRLLITLEQLGYAVRAGSAYRLQPRVLRLGFAFLSSHSLATLTGPILEEMSAALRESCSLSVLEGEDVVYLARSATKRVMSVGLSIGSRLPAYCTSMGRVLLAALPERELAEYLRRATLVRHTRKTITSRAALRAELRHVRRQGYAIVDEELELGLRALAVPVMTRSHRVVAAVNTGVHASRVSRAELLRRALSVLREGAARIGETLA